MEIDFKVPPFWIIYHAVCNIAVCEWKRSAKFQRSKYLKERINSELPETSR